MKGPTGAPFDVIGRFSSPLLFSRVFVRIDQGGGG